MKIDDQKIIALKAQVDAAVQEFDMAIVFHEVWKPAAFDQDLHARMGVSYATNAFLTIRTALRREMILALMRLWDDQARSVGVGRIANKLRDKHVIDALAVDRTSRLGLPEALDAMRRDLKAKSDAAIALVDKYSEGGAAVDVLKRLHALRNEHLAHRQVRREAVNNDATREEIEMFFSDMASLTSGLLRLVQGISYDPKDSGKVHQRYAELFWATARGEKTEGHPRYRPPPS